MRSALWLLVVVVVVVMIQLDVDIQTDRPLCYMRMLVSSRFKLFNYEERKLARLASPPLDR